MRLNVAHDQDEPYFIKQHNKILSGVRMIMPSHINRFSLLSASQIELVRGNVFVLG